jgi:hypothetical protein
VLFLDLAGPLRVSDVHGSDLTPTGQKAQGLLALIGTSPGLRRSRTWLQDKLWSDCAPAQGAASLRQCLRRLRVTLGTHADCLEAGSGWIALNAARVRVRTDPQEGVGENVEFLEGIDVRDPEFEDWLRDQRARYSERCGLDTTRTAAVTGTIAPRGIAGKQAAHRDLAAVCDHEDIGALVAVAALAGLFMQRRDGPQGRRRLKSLLEALPTSHVADACDIVGTFNKLLSAHTREVRERDHGHHPH